MIAHKNFLTTKYVYFQTTVLLLIFFKLPFAFTLGEVRHIVVVGCYLEKPRQRTVNNNNVQETETSSYSPISLDISTSSNVVLGSKCKLMIQYPRWFVVQTGGWMQLHNLCSNSNNHSSVSSHKYKLATVIMIYDNAKNLYSNSYIVATHFQNINLDRMYNTIKRNGYYYKL